MDPKGVAEKPIRDVRIRNVRAAKVANPDIVENVELVTERDIR